MTAQMDVLLKHTCEISACPGVAADPDLFCCFMASARADMSGKPAILSAFGNIPIGMNNPKNTKSNNLNAQFTTHQPFLTNTIGWKWIVQPVNAIVLKDGFLVKKALCLYSHYSIQVTLA